MEGGLENYGLQLGQMSRKMVAQLSSAYSDLPLRGEPGAVVMGSPENILGDDLGSFLMEKLRELLHLLESLPGLIREKLDQILPPETRSATLHRWLVVGLTVVLPVVLSLLCLYCCCKCFCKCCCGRGVRRVSGKMMKAPGRMGKMMPRATFESDPRGYFINLRENRDLLC